MIAALFQLFDGTQVVGLGILRGMGDVNIPTKITFIAYWIIALPAAYLIGITFKFGVTGVWYGLVLGLMTSALLLFFRFRYISKFNLNRVSKQCVKSRYLSHTVSIAMGIHNIAYLWGVPPSHAYLYRDTLLPA